MAQCYFPDGSISPLDVPCDSSSTHSACCRANNACLSTGYCFGANDGGPNILTRSTCTDSSFTDDACPYYCRDVNPSGAALLFPQVYGQEAHFCCGGFNSSAMACQDPTRGNDQPFLLPNGNVITNRTSGEALPLNETATASNGQPQATITVTSTATSTPQGKASDHDAAIGAGVGVSLGALLLIAVALLVWEMRKRKRVESQHAHEREGFLGHIDQKRGPPGYSEGQFSPSNSRQLLAGTPVAELGAGGHSGTH